jgi:hypothetical protein
VDLVCVCRLGLRKGRTLKIFEKIDAKNLFIQKIVVSLQPHLEKCLCKEF